MKIEMQTHLEILQDDGEYKEEEVEVIIDFDYDSTYNEFEINSITHDGYDVSGNETIYEKAEEEIREYLAEEEGCLEKDKEAIDILHSVETFLRIRFRGREQDLEKIIQSTIEKNSARNYYQAECHWVIGFSKNPNLNNLLT